MQVKELKIMEYGLFDFCRAVEKAINEGYSFDFSTNQRCPASYGTHMECLMIKVEDQSEVKPEVVVEAEPEVKPEVVAEVEPAKLEESVVVQAAKRGRPAKA